MNVAEERGWRRRGEERQVVIERLFVDVGRDRGMLQDRFDLGSEDEATVLVIEVERFDADAIAHEHELFLVRVPERDAVIAFDFVNEVEAALFVKVQDGFGVGARRIFVAALFEIGAKESVVVDLAVEDEPRAFVAAVHWLMAGGGKIDDGETSKSEPAAALVEDQLTSVVGAAMSHLIAHAREQRGLNRAFTGAILPNSANPTHNPCL